ncbi:hypothetical protein D3C85_1883960 [compost metagenome]
MFWQSQSQLTHHFIVVDTVNRGFRRIHRQLVSLLLGQESIFDLDQILVPQFFGRQVQTDGDALVSGG